MEQHKDARDKALKKIQIADHMLTQTYPLVNDPKLLLSVLENVFLSLTNGMAALLYYDHKYGDLPDFQDTFESKYNLFKLRLVDKYNLDRSYVTFIGSIKDIIVNHKKSPVEFARKGAFIICGDNYSTKTISTGDMRKYISTTKIFVEEINTIIESSRPASTKKQERNPFSNQGWTEVE